MLSCQRDLFDIPRSTAYLDAAYMSPITTAALAAGTRGVAVKASPWRMTISSYFDDVEEARRLAATMIGAEADDMAVVAATSYGMAIAAANVSAPAGSCIVLMENEHPSHRYVWYELARKTGAQIKIVSRPEDGDWTSAFVAAIRNSTEPISVVAGTMVHWFDGMAIDLDAVAEATRAVGASLVVDGTQWVGALPFDVRRTQPDFMVFATYKFLLGPYRLAFLYAGKRWQAEGRPLEYHAWNRIGGDKSDFYLADVPGFLPGARRFDMGQRSDFAVLPIAISALKLIGDWSVDEVNSRLVHLNRLIWQKAAMRGLAVPPAALRAPHIAVLDFAGDLPQSLAKLLKEQEIYVTVRGTRCASRRMSTMTSRTSNASSR